MPFLITVAAPITIGPYTYFMGIHDVTVKQEASVFLQDYLSTKGAGKKNKNLSISNILERALHVNPKYMEAVNAGDMETAQKLVEAVALCILTLTNKEPRSGCRALGSNCPRMQPILALWVA